uniref:Vacuolar protein sorting-associated protein 29 n=1 Tax=Meloidogyne incognita TaxID=6306 RepID=A0A914LX60_MELIC
MLVLVIGDFFIPYRAHNLPQKFRKLLVPNKMQHILCTGNVCTQETMNYLKTLTCDVHCVRGDFDEDTSYPDMKVIPVGHFRIGLVHGHQFIPWGDLKAMELAAQQMGVDVLISGHTHECAVFDKDGIFYINPGSATGAFSLIKNKVVPSFIVLDVQTDVIIAYIYRLLDDEVKVERSQFKKSGHSIGFT